MGGGSRIPAFLPDTSCLIATFCSWHVHHRAVSAEIRRRLSAGQTMKIASHTLAESYAVLTRLPAPHRLAPKVAFQLLEANLQRHDTISIGPGDGWSLLEGLARDGIGGGRTYDAIIAATAVRGGVNCLLTLNERDFTRVAPDGLQVRRPIGT